MAKRWSATFKGSGAPTTNGKVQNSAFFYLPDAATDAEAIAAATAIAGLCNGEMVGLSKQVVQGDLVGPWPALTDNGGSDRTTVLFSSATRKTYSVTLPFCKHNIDKSEIEAVFGDEDHAFQNEFGEALGKAVNVKSSHVVDGA